MRKNSESRLKPKFSNKVQLFNVDTHLCSLHFIYLITSITPSWCTLQNSKKTTTSWIQHISRENDHPLKKSLRCNRKITEEEFYGRAIAHVYFINRKLTFICNGAVWRRHTLCTHLLKLCKYRITHAQRTTRQSKKSTRPTSHRSRRAAKESLFWTFFSCVSLFNWTMTKHQLN